MAKKSFSTIFSAYKKKNKLIKIKGIKGLKPKKITLPRIKTTKISFK